MKYSTTKHLLLHQYACHETHLQLLHLKVFKRSALTAFEVLSKVFQNNVTIDVRKLPERDVKNWLNTSKVLLQ